MTEPASGGDVAVFGQETDAPRRDRPPMPVGCSAPRIPDPAVGDDAHRHPNDVIRLVSGTAVVVVSAWLAGGGRVPRLEADVFRLANDLPDMLSPPLQLVMQAGTFGALWVAGAVAFATRRRRLARDLTVAGTAAWVGGKIVKALVGRGRPAGLLAGVTLRGGPEAGLGFPSGHAAVAAALATAAGPYLSRRARRLSWAGVLLVSIARLDVGAHLPLDVLGGIGLGWAVGAAVHLVWGAPGGRPKVNAVRAALARSGLAPLLVAPAAVDARASTPFLAVSTDGRDLFVKLVGREQRDADWLFKAWRWLAYREVEDEAPFATGKQLIEHEAYLSLLASDAGVRTPAIVTTASTAEGSAMLVTERVLGCHVDAPDAPPPSDDFLHAVWGEVAKLAAVRIAHRDLRLANLLVDGAGRPWITDFGFAQSNASERRLAQDRAELLASLAPLTGAARAVASASAVLGPAALVPALPLLQPMALTAATRRQLRKRPDLLGELRAEVASVTGVHTDATTREPLTRVRPRTVVALLVGAVAVHVLIPQAAELRHTLDALQRAHWAWLIPAAAASALTYVMAAMAVISASGLPLPMGRTVLAQLGSSVANRLAPGGLGGAATNVRYLRRSGLDRAEAVTAVALAAAAGFGVHALGLLGVGTALASTGVVAPRLPHHWALLVIVAVALAATGLLMWTPLGRRRIRPVVVTTVRGLQGLLHQPRRAVLLVIASCGVTSGYILALAAALHAFGAHPPLLTVAAAYLAGAAIGSASPTPGGLGAVEAATVAGLTRLGVLAGPAIAGILAFRFLTYWLPILPGAVALRVLRRDRAL